MPALPLDLLPEVLFQPQGQTGLAAAEPFGHLLQVAAAHSAHRQLAQQGDDTADGLLELVRATQVEAREHLLDLPVEPQRGLVQQAPVLAGPMLLEVLIGILARRQL